MLTIIVELIVMKNMNRNLLLFSTFVVFCLILLPVGHSLSVSPIQRAVEWQDVQLVSETGLGHYHNPQIVVANGQCYAVWEHVISLSVNHKILFSSFNGKKWASSVQLNTDESLHKDPSVAVENERVHVVWARRAPGENYTSLVYRYFDGITWIPNIRVGIEEEGSSLAAWHPRIVAERNRLHLVWIVGKTHRSSIYYRHFDGTTWQPPVEIGLTNSSSIQEEPSLVVANGKIHVVWTEYHYKYPARNHIFYQHFDREKWHPPELISSFGEQPDIAVQGDSVHVVWAVDKLEQDEVWEQHEFDIYYRRFDGRTWQPPYGLSPKPSDKTAVLLVRFQHRPNIVAQHGQLYATWLEYILTNEGQLGLNAGLIILRHYDGTTWQPEERVQQGIKTEYGNPAGYPILAGDSTALHLVWLDLDETFRYSKLYHRFSIIEVKSSRTETSEHVTSDKATTTVDEGLFVPSRENIIVIVAFATSLYGFKHHLKKKP